MSWEETGTAGSQAGASCSVTSSLELSSQVQFVKATKEGLVCSPYFGVVLLPESKEPTACPSVKKRRDRNQGKETDLVKASPEEIEETFEGARENFQ
jgi:hypothetical protein